MYALFNISIRAYKLHKYSRHRPSSARPHTAHSPATCSWLQEAIFFKYFFFKIVESNYVIAEN